MEEEGRVKVEYLAGIHPVKEALKKGERVERLLIKKGTLHSSISHLLKMAKREGIPIDYLSSEELEELAGTSSHQGVVARAYSKGYLSLEDLYVLVREVERPLVVLLDQVQDPQNLGAIIRSSYLLGAHAVVIPKDRRVGLTSAVYRAAAGAVEHIPVVQVTNIVRTIDGLKERGLWIVGGVAEGGEVIYHQDLTGPLGILIGNEGKGLRRLVRESCDFLLEIPVKKEMDSLNASVAAGIFLYEIRRQSLMRDH